MAELSREYRKAAEQSVRDGDYRRAAYIYGKLLGDDRMAAQSLQRGGLHRDAAILYLRKLNDRARGRTGLRSGRRGRSSHRALSELGNHAAAGDLLRRIGEEEAAVAEYRGRRPPRLIQTGAGSLAAGDLLLKQGRAGRPGHGPFRRGLGRRPDQCRPLRPPDGPAPRRGEGSETPPGAARPGRRLLRPPRQ